MDGINETNKGRRVELVFCDDPYTKLRSGDKGTYEYSMKMEMGRGLVVPRSGSKCNSK